MGLLWKAWQVTLSKKVSSEMFRDRTVIIGGGLAGVSLLYCLSKANYSPVLLEKSVIGGGGATSHSRGIVRIYDPIPELVDYAIEGLHFWQEFGKLQPGLFNPAGAVYFVAPQNIASVEDFLRQNSNRLPALELVDAEYVEEICPFIHPQFKKKSRKAIWEPNSGYIDPRMAARELANQALESGATIVEGVNVTGIEFGENVSRIHTDSGNLEARNIIVANGAALNQFGLHDTIECRSISLTSFVGPIEQIPKVCVMDEVSQSYLRPGENGHFFIGGAKPNSARVPEKLAIDNAQVKNDNTSFCHTLLKGDEFQPLAIHNGYDAYTESYLPIVKAPKHKTPGVFAGFSGRGAKYIPALAKIRVENWINEGLI